jgi:protoporphyrinogen oxidase
VKEESKKTIIIVGAGPAGLTAAYELSSRSDHQVIVLEGDKQVGGISKTVDYKGNKIDIGGHRFFSKSNWVLDWWQKFLPILSDQDKVHTTYQNESKSFHISKDADPSAPHMLVRPRKSRIYYNRHFFDYPIKLNFQTIIGIGFWKSVKMFFSLLKSKISPVSENNLEDFYINRFGYELYATFFKDYTEKVWGKQCSQISAEWGRQRVKGLGIRKIIKHYFTTLFYPQNQKIGNKKTEQTLTEFFLYPQQGPGQLWELVAESCTKNNVDIRFQNQVIEIQTDAGTVTGVHVKGSQPNTSIFLPCDMLISTMPVKNLIQGLGTFVPDQVRNIGVDLEYRDFIIVGLLLDEMSIEKKHHTSLDDNWLYIQDGNVQLGRVQLFHNWSPDMVSKSGMSWIGAEYFCQENDELWSMEDQDLIKLASKELSSIGLIDDTKVIDGTVVRMPKAYPSYVGSYGNFDQVKEFLNTIPNLFLIGRNGTHKYNNQDHSMITAREAVDTILSGSMDKSHIWDVNADQEYHEAY